MTRTQRALLEAEDALYAHEQPFYRYCASGFPLTFASKNYVEHWELERKALEAKCKFLRVCVDIETHYPQPESLSVI